MIRKIVSPVSGKYFCSNYKSGLASGNSPVLFLSGRMADENGAAT